MSAILTLIAYGVPWWVQGLGIAILVGVIAFGVAHVFGLRRALQLGGVLGALGALVISRQQARQEGWRARGDQDAEATRQRGDDREAILADLRTSGDADLDRRLDRWVRDDKR